MIRNKILMTARWISSHLVHICGLLYFLVLFTLSVLDGFSVNINFNKCVEDSEPIINLIISSLGIGGAIVLYSEYFAQKQHEAVFGFYSNMRVFLKRLNVFLGDNFSQSTIIVKLYTESALHANTPNVPSEEYMNAFRELCCDFLKFLSESKDNIPAKQGNEDFMKWYESQMNIVELLQKGVLFTEKYYGNYSDRSELEAFYQQIKNNINYIDIVIEKKIQEDSFRS